MYPDLSYLLHDLLGTSPDNWTSIFKTYGLFLVLAILAAAWALRLELVRRAAEGQFTSTTVQVVSNQPITPGQYAINGLFGFFLGFKLVYILQNFPELQRDAAGVLLSGKGSMVGGLLGGLALLVYYYFLDRQLRSRGVVKETKQLWPHDRLGDITIIAAISGVVGAKVFDILEHLPDFFRDPVGVFFSGSGLAIYGGLIGGFVGVASYLRYRRIPLPPVMDAVAPALMLGYAVGRLGCHFSGDGDWGLPAGPTPSWWFLPQWLWAYDYPHNVISEGPAMADCALVYCSRLAEAVHPTAVYESLAALAIAGVLWVVRRPLQPVTGLLFSAYLFLNGLERWTIEKIRVNPRYDFAGGLTQAEIIALALMLVGAAWGAWLWWRRR